MNRKKDINGVFLISYVKLVCDYLNYRYVYDSNDRRVSGLGGE